MVGPPSDDDPNRSGRRQLKVSIVVLVGVSAGLIVVSSGGSLLEVGAAVVAGLAVGAALLAYLVRISK